MCKVKPVLILSGLLLVTCHLLAQSPGGILKHSFWLQGNFPNEISPQKAALNFHPAISTDESKAGIKLPRNIQSLRRVTIFTVYQNPANDEEAVWEMTGDVGDVSLSTRQVSSESNNTSLVFFKNKPAKAEAIIHTYFGNLKSASGNENIEAAEAAIRFGQLTNSPSGPISEFILYEKILGEAQINKIETYLALKYGITLQRNYVAASGEVVWNYKNDSIFSNNIAGIARDDQSALYQKQGTSANAPGQIAIGIDKITTLNSNNAGELKDRNYLIWGDNGASFTIKENIEPAEFLLPEKTWLMKRSGNNADKIATELQLDVKAMLTGNIAKDSLYLIIDRSGTAKFTAQNSIYLKPDVISPEGIASFKNVFWDTDGSGKDAFTFGIRSAMMLVKGNNKDAASLVSFQLYPNPVTGGQYKIAITLNKPSDIQIMVYDMHQRLVHSAKGAGQSSYLFPGQINGAAGPYTIRVVTPHIEYSRIVIVQ